LSAHGDPWRLSDEQPPINPISSEGIGNFWSGRSFSMFADAIDQQMGRKADSPLRFLKPLLRNGAKLLSVPQWQSPWQTALHLPL
jgi:hypothetical protein